MRRNTFRKNRKNAGVNVLGIVAIIIAAALAGFLITKFVIYPVMLGATDVLTKQEQKTEQDEPQGDQEKDKDADKAQNSSEAEKATEQLPEKPDDAAENPPLLQSGYCIQFGSFSTQEAADKLVAELKQGGVNASISEKDGVYKVVGEIFSDKDSAKAAAEQIDRAVYHDIFVTQI